MAIYFFQEIYLAETRSDWIAIVIVHDTQIYNDIYLFQHILTTYLQSLLCGSVFLIRIHKHTTSNTLVIKRDILQSQKQASHFT